MRGDEVREREIKDNLIDIQITSKDAIKAMDYRQKNMFFPRAKLIEEGGDNIDDDLDVMRASLLSKDGIVSQEAQKDFRFFIGNCMNRQILD